MYLQRKNNLTRDVYPKIKLKDPGIFGARNNQIIKLEKPLYGLCDSGDYLEVKINAHVGNDLRTIWLLSDSALRVKLENDRLIGLSGTQVDDSLKARNKAFKKLTELTLEKFDPKSRVYGSFDFIGMQIICSWSKIILLDDLTMP